MNLPSQVLALLVLLALTWVGGCLYGARSQPEVVRTRTEYVDRTLRETDTVEVQVPVTQTRYRTQTDTVNLCAGRPLYVPRRFDLGGLVPRRPVSRQGRSLVLTTWQPDSLRWVQERYRIPTPRWGLQATAYVGTDLVRLADNLVLSARLEGRWRGVRAYVEPRADLGESLAEGSLTAGVGLDLWRWSR